MAKLPFYKDLKAKAGYIITMAANASIPKRTSTVFGNACAIWTTKESIVSAGAARRDT